MPQMEASGRGGRTGWGWAKGRARNSADAERVPQGDSHCRRWEAQVLTGAGIDGKPEARVAEVRVQRLSGDAGLHGAIKVLCVDLCDLVHFEQIEADAALGWVGGGFEGGVSAGGAGGVGRLVMREDEP